MTNEFFYVNLKFSSVSWIYKADTDFFTILPVQIDS